MQVILSSRSDVFPDLLVVTKTRFNAIYCLQYQNRLRVKPIVSETFFVESMILVLQTFQFIDCLIREVCFLE